MFSKLSNKRVLIPLLIAAIVLIIISVVYVCIVSTRPLYEGTTAKLSKADEKSSVKINNAVLNMPPKIKSGEQATIRITKFAGNYAQGVVSYSNKSLSQQFMAVKTGENWTIVTHNSGKNLDLPDVKTAEKYGLPQDWFKR